jgi:hypothetical protein
MIIAQKKRVMHKSTINTILVSTLLILGIAGLALGSFEDPLVRGVKDQVKFLTQNNREVYGGVYGKIYTHPELGFSINAQQVLDLEPRQIINEHDEPLVMFARSLDDDQVEILAQLDILTDSTRIFESLMIDAAEVFILPGSIDDFPNMDIFTNTDGTFRMFAITAEEELYRLQSFTDANGLTYIDPFSLQLPIDTERDPEQTPDPIAP